MAGANNDYPNTRVGFEQSPGATAVDTLFMDAAGNFGFFGNDITGQQMFNVTNGRINTVIMINSAGVLSAQAEALSPPYLPSQNALILLSLAEAASAASAILPSAKEGQKVKIALRGLTSTAAITLFAAGATSGFADAVVVSPTASNLSGITLNGASTVISVPFVELIAQADGTWAVSDWNTNNPPTFSGA